MKVDFSPWHSSRISGQKWIKFALGSGSYCVSVDTRSYKLLSILNLPSDKLNSWTSVSFLSVKQWRRHGEWVGPELSTLVLRLILRLAQNCNIYGWRSVVELLRGEEGVDKGTLSVGSIFQLKKWVWKIEVGVHPHPRQFEPRWRYHI